MLPKSQRLSVRDIASLSNGKGVFGSLLSIRYLFTSQTKFSVSVSKKIAKNAVDRNRIRRRVYTAIRTANLNIKKSAFIMVIPKKDCEKAQISSIKEEISSILYKISVIA